MVPARAANVLPGLCPALFPGPAGVAAGWPAPPPPAREEDQDSAAGLPADIPENR